MAAKKNNKSRRQGWVSKGINIGLIVLGFSRVLEHLFARRGFADKLRSIRQEATFGLSEGKFDLQGGLRMYTPAGAAAGLGMLKSYLMKKFPVRR